MKRTIFWPSFIFLLGLLFILSANTLENWAYRSPDLPEAAQELASQLAFWEQDLEQRIERREFLMRSVDNEWSEDSLAVYNALPYTLLIYNESDSLIYWNNNKVEPYQTDVRYKSKPERRIMDMAGSKYLMIKRPFKVILNQQEYRYTLLGLLPVYLRFPVQNGYLDNNFPLMSEEFGEFVRPSTDSSAQLVLDDLGLEYLRLEEQPNFPYRDSAYGALALYLLGAFCWIALLFRLAAQLTKQRGQLLGTLFFLFGSLSLRLLGVYTELPRLTHDLPLFSFKLSDHDSLWFYALGDLLLDLGWIVALLIFILANWQEQAVGKWSNWRKNGLAIFIFSVLVGGFLALEFTLRDIVLNANVYLEFENSTRVDAPSFLAMLALVVLFFSYFLLVNKLYRMLALLNWSYLQQASFLLICLLFGAALGLSMGLPIFYILALATFVIAFGILLLWFVQEKQLTFMWLTVWLLFFSGVGTLLIEQANHEKNLALRQDFLKVLTFEQDPKVEEAFLELEPKLLNDNFFKVYFSSLYIPYSQVVDRLTYLYLDNAFFGRYDYNIYLYNSLNLPKKGDQLPYGQLKDIFERSQKMASPNLYFYSEKSGRFVYYADLELREGNKLLGRIVLELRPKEEDSQNSIYVELLSLPKSRLEQTYGNFEYALYKGNQRVLSKDGDFAAYLAIDEELPEPKRFLRKKKGDKTYLLYQDERNYLGLVALQATSWLQPFSLFSYIFCIGFLLLFLLFISLAALKYLFQWQPIVIEFKASLRERIQQGIVLVSLFSFIAIGVVTIFYFQNEYNDYHKQRLERKIASTAKTASWQIVNRPDSSQLIPDAKDLANIHKIDVNVYGLNGQLLSSSEDAIFERRLLSRQMDPLAYRKMRFEQLDNYPQRETINNLEYLSGYVPLRDEENNIIAFLNLPYDLAGSNNIRSQDVAEFLGALLNVYVIFLILAAGVAFLIANSVTRPLSLIGEKLRLIKVGEKNEQLEWKGRDEIGDFVRRFNEMLLALEESSEKLAQSQRESAWRDMAKQVAHEIKNPLTPMKLQLQLLERAAQKSPEKAQQMMPRISKALVEQIDNLARIASEFSNFAKMPPPENEVIALDEMLQSIQQLFKENESETEIELLSPLPQLAVWADRSQMLRILNNLVKNAIQAIPEEQKGRVQIQLEQAGEDALVLVRDNGCGIPEEQRKRIFVPYFTTKSSGTGIGLSMCRKMIRAMQGEIYFETEEGQGTDFYIRLPLFKQD